MQGPGPMDPVNNAMTCCFFWALESVPPSWPELVDDAPFFLDLEEALLPCLCVCFHVSWLSTDTGAIGLVPVDLD